MPKGMKSPIEMMLRAMREIESGIPVSVACKKAGMSEKAFHRYREKYAGHDPGEARRLRELEEENQRLKKGLSEQTLHNEELREVASKKKW